MELEVPLKKHKALKEGYHPQFTLKMVKLFSWWKSKRSSTLWSDIIYYLPFLRNRSKYIDRNIMDKLFRKDC